MLARPNLFVFSLLLIVGGFAGANDGTTECGAVLNGPIDDDAIYVHCPSLTGLSKYDAYIIIESVLHQSPQNDGDIIVIFLSDPTVLDRDWQYQNLEKRLASWGDAVVGMYNRSSHLLMYRSSSDGKWRRTRLEI